MRRTMSIIILALFLLTLAGCSLYGAPDQAEENEIKVLIDLDLMEDIGLLLTGYTVNGEEGMSGTSNADKSMLQKDSKNLLWSYNREFLDDPAGDADVTLQFIVVTEYFEPDYDFNYPEEAMIPMEPVSFTAEPGVTYRVTITGDLENRYTASLDAP